MQHFDKTRRLRTKGDYDYVFSRAKKVVTPEFTVLYRKNTLQHARLGLALAKKVVPPAHERNRIKRIIRESFRKTTLPAMDMVFLAKKGIALLENGRLFASLNEIWKKIGR